MADVLITGYENEDIVRPFAIQTGPVSAPVAFDLTHYDLEMDICDAKTAASVLRLSTNGVDNRITIDDAVNGIISIHIPHSLIPYNAKQQLRYDLLTKSKIDGSFRWLFGGPVKILDGLTNPL